MVEMLLPPGVRSRLIEGVNGLCMHILEAGYDTSKRPCILLLHGFPELAYSWRKLLLPLAELGFHVVAPDQRGYGQTTGWDGRFDGDWRSSHLLNIVRDKLALTDALGLEKVHAVIGHDFGSPVAAYCSLIRPDVFRSVVMMSAPFGGTPVWSAPSSGDEIHAELAALDPPRKHYQWYYSTSRADNDMRLCPQGIHAFLRAYFHVKSADWLGNEINPLQSWTASELAKLPTYYVMNDDQTMAECVAPHMPNADAIATCKWLPDSELSFYSDSFSKTGIQGGLNWYRCMTDHASIGELRLFSKRTIDVPSCFIGGRHDWGVYQLPGAFERMQEAACSDMRQCHLVDGAGHWVQQEQPQRVTDLLKKFLNSL